MHAKVTINVYINTPINPTKNTCPFADFCLHCLHLSPFTPVVCKSESTFEGLIKSSPYPLYFLRSIEPETRNKKKQKINLLIQHCLCKTLTLHDFLLQKIWHLGKCNYMYIITCINDNFKLIWRFATLSDIFSIDCNNRLNTLTYTLNTTLW